MGTAASLLNVESSAELTAEIKTEYEKLKSEGVSDEEIQTKLTAQFSERVNQAKKTASPTMVPKKTTILPSPDKIKQQSGRNRRQSFGEDTKKSPNKHSPNKESAMAASLSSPGIIWKNVLMLNEFISTLFHLVCNICNFHVLSHLLLIYRCKLHWNFNSIALAYCCCCC